MKSKALNDEIVPSNILINFSQKEAKEVPSSQENVLSLKTV